MILLKTVCVQHTEYSLEWGQCKDNANMVKKIVIKHVRLNNVQLLIWGVVWQTSKC